ncbi:MAG: hypothetical protein PWR30_120 [Candidatus Woesearchaeota archaeon]|nr:hypothetical protein [Candidatus Woesearchaeota archaeon]
MINQSHKEEKKEAQLDITNLVRTRGAQAR